MNQDVIPIDATPSALATGGVVRLHNAPPSQAAAALVRHKHLVIL